MADTNKIDVTSHIFVAPTKQLNAATQMSTWTDSQAYADIVGFICAMNEAVKDKKLTEDFVVSPPVERLVSMLQVISTWVDDIPPIDQPQRFGNKAFKQFYEKLLSESSSLLKQALDETFHGCIPEVSVYLNESFGNATRIDYGTGHELAFLAFLCCLYKLAVLAETDATATVFCIFKTYIDLCRKLQRTYKMEPAGSHGVWSLDDFQFVPFIWGSSQLMGHRRITPARAVEQDYYESFHKDYIYLAAIKHICSVKTGPFAEHSNQLWNISGVPLWSKVNSGLIKMYKAELLAKFPVIQHFLFGSLLTLAPNH